MNIHHLPLLLFVLLFLNSCSNTQKIGDLEYRSAGSQYVGDLGQAVMIERAGTNHAVPLTNMNMGGVQFKGSSGKIYQERETSFTGTAKLKPISLGSITDSEINLGSAEENKPNYYSKKKGSHIVFYPSEYFDFIRQLNSQENFQARKNIRDLSDKHNRAMGIITRVTRVYGHESTREISLGLGITGKYNAAGEFTSSVKYGNKSETKLPDGAVSGYLVARIYWSKDNPYKIDNLLEIDYVGIDSPYFRWLNWFRF